MTLRNARNVFIALVVLFILITIRSEMPSNGNSSFGRLLDREIPQVESKPVEVVQEATPHVSDETSADPMLVAPAAREQWLHDNSATSAAAVIEPMPAPVTSVARPGTGSRVAIVGGPEGVSVVEQKRRRPVLTGGFGR